MDRLLTISSELKATYLYYPELFAAYHDKDSNHFFRLLQTMPNTLPEELRHVKRAFFKYESGIRLAFIKPYSNCRLENLHTHIKALKRIAYGFRDFSNVWTRIFLLSDLIQYK